MYLLFPKSKRLRAELYRGTRGCGVPGHKPRGAQEKIRLQVPPNQGKWSGEYLSGERHLLPQEVQHVCYRWIGRFCQYLGWV